MILLLIIMASRTKFLTVPSNRAVTISAILGVMLYTAVRGADTSTRRFLDDFKKHVRGGHLQDQAVTKQIADPLIMTNLPAIVSTDVSGSHVLRARMREQDAENFIKNFLQDYQSRYGRAPTTASR